MHAVNDHPKRDHIFCLSTSAGNTHYLQVCVYTALQCCVYSNCVVQTKNQSEVDDWMTTIHCGGCTPTLLDSVMPSLSLTAAAMAATHQVHKDEAVKILKVRHSCWTHASHHWYPPHRVTLTTSTEL